MIYGYARVSTIAQAKDGNSLEAQHKALAERGASVIYHDSYTGTKSDRPEFCKLLAKLRKGDTILVTKIDRLTRSLEQGIRLVNKLLQEGITVHILNIGVIDTSPTGKLILNILMSFAEFERDMIVERTQEGKRIAKANNPNFKEGRPARGFDVQLYKNEYDLVKRGVKTSREVINELKITKSYWYRAIKKI